MRAKFPHLRTPLIAPARAPILRYGVAVLSIVLALIPAVLLANVVESRLAVFAVAIMVSAWYGGWKPGLVATSFALTVSAYFSLGGHHSAAENRQAIFHLALFVSVAGLICWFNAALRGAQEGLRRSELNFRSLVTNAPYGICRFDHAGTIVEGNPALVSMLGYESNAELAGRNLTSLHTDVQQWFELADRFRSGHRFSGIPAEWVCKNGKTIAVRLSGNSVREGNADFFELYAEDVTERRALELQLRQSQKMEAVGRLAGGIAHDFNNLLMVISGYCEFLMNRSAMNPELSGPAGEIAAAADRATTLTRQLLAFSRKQMLAPKVFDLNSVVNENLKMLARLIGEDIDLVRIPGVDLGRVKADPGQIEQVIMNLAVNARDAMPRGGRLTIETSNIYLDESYTSFHTPVKPGEYVMLAVSDNGGGMDTETQSHIFEPFFTTKGQQGTGLGLSTVYGIVKQSGGYVWVYSEVGRGTTFKIYLPRVVESGESAAQDSPAPQAQYHRAQETILLVEDEVTLRGLVRQYLESQGYTVLEAPDGASAIALSATHPGPIHLLLTDVIMPGMNGRELSQRISSVRPETKVLFVSGYTENVIGENGMLEPGVSFLQKPFSLTALRTRVRELLDQPVQQEVSSAARIAALTYLHGREKFVSLRAQRFNLQVPLRYRLVGEREWRQGTTENISRSGMLFRAEEMVSPSALVEINMVLPVEIAGLAAAEVICRGEVVRTLMPEKSSQPPALAAKILQYQFQHSPRAAHA
ncbi:MAG TPA: ATP-binding protein [Terriglobales bacterium]|nr:ATP-binding protein [Terriglobales bacterium]